MLDTFDTGQLIFDFFGNVVFELGRCRARQGDGYHHGRQINVRELLHLHLHKAIDTAQRQQYKQQNSDQRISNRISRYI